MARYQIFRELLMPLKIRRTKKTILIVGEGPTEKSFLQHLKQLYISRDMNINVKVECGSGGSPIMVIQKTMRLKSSRDYDKCYVLIDSDVTFDTDKELLKLLKRNPVIEILKATPCIEGLFLAILKYPDFSQKNIASAKCKSIFEKEYLSYEKKTETYAYEKIFSKQVLNERRNFIPELDAILKAMGINK